MLWNSWRTCRGEIYLINQESGERLFYEKDYLLAEMEEEGKGETVRKVLLDVQVLRRMFGDKLRLKS